MLNGGLLHGRRGDCPTTATAGRHVKREELCSVIVCILVTVMPRVSTDYSGGAMGALERLFPVPALAFPVTEL